MSSQQRFTGRQITTMVVALCAAIALAPASAVAVGELVKITDNDGGVAKVTGGKLEVTDGAGAMTVNGTNVAGPPNRILAHGDCDTLDGEADPVDGLDDSAQINASQNARVMGIVFGAGTETYETDAEFNFIAVNPQTEEEEILVVLRSSYYGSTNNFIDDDATFGEGLIVPGFHLKFDCNSGSGGAGQGTWLVYGRTS